MVFVGCCGGVVLVLVVVGVGGSACASHSAGICFCFVVVVAGVVELLGVLLMLVLLLFAGDCWKYCAVVVLGPWCRS